MRFHIPRWAAVPPVLLSAFPLYAQVAPGASGAPDVSQGTLPPVVVTATRQAERADALLSDVTVIDQAEIQRNIGNTVADLLTRQPGIQMSRSGGPGTGTGLFLRGANTDQTLVLVDGLPVAALDPSGSPLPNLPLADVDHIEIVRGPASTLYGANAVGGVIQIFTKKGQPGGVRVDGFAGYGTHATRRGQVGLSAGGDLWRLRADGFYAASNSISAQKNATSHDADTDPYRRGGGSVSLALLPAAGHELGLSYREASGQTRYDGGNTPADGDFDDRLRWRDTQWQVYAQNRIMPVWNSTLRYGQTHDQQTSFGAWAPAGGTLAVTVRQLGWQNDLTLPARWGRLLVALERQQKRGSSSDGLANGNGMDNDSALAGWTGSLGAHSWQINARYDHNSVYGGKATYSAAYGYQIAPEWRARASFGTAFKAPTLYQLYAPFFGNAALRPETSTNREIGLTWERGGQSASATWYLNRVSQMIDWSPVTFVYENVNRARLQGVTLAYDGRFGDWAVRATYDWLQARNENTGLLLGRRARHKALLGLSRRWGAWTAGAEWQLVGARYDNNANTARLGGYGLINLTLRYAINQTVSIEGRIDNLLGKHYELARGYNTPGFTAFVGARFAVR
jgi:vitamin B12 transporter